MSEPIYDGWTERPEKTRARRIRIIEKARDYYAAMVADNPDDPHCKAHLEAVQKELVSLTSPPKGGVETPHLRGE